MAAENKEKKPLEKKTTASKTPAKKTVKKAVKKEEAPHTDEERILSSEEAKSVDALLDTGKEEPARLDEEKPDATEQTLNEVKESDAGQEMNKVGEAEAKKQSEYEKNVFIPLSKPDYEGDLCEEKVEEKRKKFSAAIKKTRRFSSIVMLILIVGLIGGFVANIYITNMKWIVYTIFGVLVAFVIVAFIVSSRMKKGMYSDIDVYVKDAFTIVDSYVFNDDEFINPAVSKTGHIDVSTIGDAHYFDVIDTVNSRNIVSLSFLGKNMTVSEVAAKVPVGPVKEAAPEQEKAKIPSKDNQPKQAYGIFGKFIAYPLALAEGAGVIIQLKGVNSVDPSYLDGYAEISISDLNENYVVYTDNASICQKMFESGKITEVLNTIQSDQCLENLFFCVNPRGLRFCLNYNESVMEIPMERGLNGKPYLHYKDDVQKVKTIIKELVK